MARQRQHERHQVTVEPPWRLTFLCHEFVPIGGGAASSLDALTKVLARRGKLIQIITIGLGRQTTEEVDPFGRHVTRFGVGRRKRLCPTTWDLVRSYVALRFESIPRIREFAPDLLVAYFAFPAGRAALALRKRFEIPLIVSLRGSDVPGFADARWGAARWAQTHVVRPVWKQSDLLLANGSHLVELARRFAAPPMAINLANGIDTDRYAPALVERSAAPLRILFVGQLIERKRCRDALNAVRWLGDRGVPARLTVVGEGPRRNELEAMRSTLPQGVEVTMAGVKKRTEMPDVYREHDALVLLSSAEGVSNVFMEALASGLAVVCTRDAARDFCRNHPECAIFVDSTDPAAVGGELLRLANDVGTRRRLQRTARSVAAAFDWEQAAVRFEHYAGQLLQERQKVEILKRSRLTGRSDRRGALPQGSFALR